MKRLFFLYPNRLKPLGVTFRTSCHLRKGHIEISCFILDLRKLDALKKDEKSKTYSPKLNGGLMVSYHGTT